VALIGTLQTVLMGKDQGSKYPLRQWIESTVTVCMSEYLLKRFYSKEVSLGKLRRWRNSNRSLKKKESCDVNQ